MHTHSHTLKNTHKHTQAYTLVSQKPDPQIPPLLFRTKCLACETTYTQAHMQTHRQSTHKSKHTIHTCTSTHHTHSHTGYTHKHTHAHTCAHHSHVHVHTYSLTGCHTRNHIQALHTETAFSNCINNLQFDIWISIHRTNS